MTMTRSHSIMLVGLGAVLLIAAHGVVVWGGVSLSSKTGGWLPWIGGGALAFAVYHLIQAFGVYHVVRHIRGRAVRVQPLHGHPCARSSDEHRRGPQAASETLRPASF
jgi:hypothetical protein